MSIEADLKLRSSQACELCGSTQALDVYPVSPKAGNSADECAYLCSTCRNQLAAEALDSEHWRCLTESMWSQTPAIQVLAWRLLNRLNAEPWAQQALDMLYLDESIMTWAQASGTQDEQVIHRDSNGAVLSAGDTVTLIKDLVVKGANFTAKRGTAVRNISLVPDNAAQIEGRVNDQHIVILTQFVKKAS